MGQAVVSPLLLAGERGVGPRARVLAGSPGEPVKFEEYWRSCARSARTPFASARSCGRGRP